MKQVDLHEARRRSGSGPLLLVTRRAGMLLANLMMIVVLARLVPPSAFGLANMAAVFLNFGQILRDFGMTNAVLRKPVLDPVEVNFVFWFNALATLLIALVLALLAPAIADYFGEPVVLWVVLVSLVGFVANGLSMQHRALLNRDLQFGLLGVVDVVAAIANLVVSVTLGFLWGNVWAIVLGLLAQSVVTGACYVWFSGWRPGRPQRPENLREIVGFGVNSAIFAISTFFSNNAAALLIGRFISSDGLGQYNRAQTLYQIPTTNFVQPMAQATIPLLSRLRAHPAEYRAAYLELVGKLCIVLIPAAAALTVAGPELTLLVLGPQWGAAGIVFAALAPSLAGVGLSYVVSDLFYTQDRTAELRSIGLIEMVVRVGAIMAAVRHGLLATAAAYSVATLLCALLRLFVAGRKGPVTVRDQWLAAMPALPMAAVASIAAFAARELMQGRGVPVMLSGPALFLAGMVPALLLGLALPASRLQLFALARNFGAQRIARIGRKLMARA